jgi:hypothetical protein
LRQHPFIESFTQRNEEAKVIQWLETSIGDNWRSVYGIRPRMEECARSMRQRSNYAAKKDAQINLSKEECAVCIKHGAKINAK